MASSEIDVLRYKFTSGKFIEAICDKKQFTDKKLYYWRYNYIWSMNDH